MSGYSSKSEAAAVVKKSIPNVAERIGTPLSPSAYYVSRVLEDVAQNRGHRYGWGLAPDVTVWEDSLRKNLRPAYKMDPEPWEGCNDGPVSDEELQRLIAEDA